MKKMALVFVSIGLLWSCATKSTSEMPQAEEVSEVKEKQLVEKTIMKTFYVIKTERTFYSDDILDSVFEGKYDKQGMPLELVTKDNAGELRERVVYKKKGANQEISTFDENGAIVDITLAIYDEMGNLAREEITDKENNPIIFNLYEYDEIGQKVKWTAQDKDQVILAEAVYKYKGDGKLEKIEFMNPSGDLTGWIEYNYKGDLLQEEVYYMEDGSVDKRVEYDIEGDTVTAAKYYQGKKTLKRQEMFETDPEGNIVKVSFLDKRGNLLEYKEREYIPFTQEVTVKVWE